MRKEPLSRGSAGPTRTACLALAAGLVAVVLAAVSSPLFDLDRHSVPKELALHLAVLVAAPACLVAARRLAVTWIDASLAALLALGTASSLTAPNPWLASRSLAVTLSGATAFWAARALANRGRSQLLLTAVAGATVLAALTALAQAYGIDVPLFASARAPGGTFGNRNFMAHLAAVGLPTLALVALTSRTRLRFAAAAAGVGAVAAALLLSRTRAAWLAMGLCCTFAAGALLCLQDLRRRPHLLGRALSLLLALALGAGLAAVVPNDLDWRSRSPYLDTARDVVNYREGSGRGRLIQYRNTLGMVLDHPFLGVGPGNWPLVYPLYASRRDPSLAASGAMPTNPWPSSDWVGFLAEVGPLGFACLAAAAVGLWRTGWKGIRGVPGAHDRLEALALLCTLLSAGIVGAFDAVLHLGAPSLLFWTTVGALAPAASPAWAPELGRGRRRWLVACAFLVLGIGVFRSASQTAAILVAGPGWNTEDLELASRLDPGNYRLHLLLARAWARRGRCDRARLHAEAAADQLPYSPEPRRLLEACGGRRG